MKVEFLFVCCKKLHFATKYWTRMQKWWTFLLCNFDHILSHCSVKSIKSRPLPHWNQVIVKALSGYSFDIDGDGINPMKRATSVVFLQLSKTRKALAIRCLRSPFISKVFQFGALSSVNTFSKQMCVVYSWVGMSIKSSTSIAQQRTLRKVEFRFIMVFLHDPFLSWNKLDTLLWDQICLVE